MPGARSAGLKFGPGEGAISANLIKASARRMYFVPELIKVNGRTLCQAGVSRLTRPTCAAERERLGSGYRMSEILRVDLKEIVLRSSVRL